MAALRFIRQLKRNLRDYGLSITLRKCLTFLAGVLCKRTVYRIYRIDLEHWSGREPGCDGLTYGFIGPEDTDAIAQIEGLEEWLQETLCRRLGQGALCLVARDGGNVAGFNLVSFGRVWIPLLETEWSFGPHQAWSEQITVHPQYRGYGIASELRYRVFDALKSRRVRLFYGGALPFNIASLKLARRVGFQEILDVHYRRVLGFYKRWRYVRLAQRTVRTRPAVGCDGRRL